MRNMLLPICLLFLCPLSLAYAAVSPLAALSTSEQDYYVKIFDYTMDNIQPDKEYAWKSYGGNGSITVGKPFLSKSGSSCRNFTETFTVHEQEGKDRGVGCKRKGKDGWCKLDGDKAQTCAFEEPVFSIGGAVNTPSIGVPALGGGNSGSGSGGSNGSGGGVSSPNVETNVNRPKDVTAKGYADTVTGSAGKAAGSATSNGISWFTGMFR